MGQFISCGNNLRRRRKFHAAVKEGNVEYVEQAITDNPDILFGRCSYKLYSPLHTAAACGNLEMLIFLLERGANINARDRHGRTPLMVACRKAKWNCVQYLLEKGADVLVFSFYCKFTCLHYAAKLGHVDSVRKILTAAKTSRIEDSWGSKRFVNARDRYGVTALHLAVRKGHCDIARLLLEHGALVSAATYTFSTGSDQGRTPLHYAARYGSMECIRELLAWGADRNQMDFTGYTPCDIALIYGHNGCASLLDPESAEPLVWPSPWSFMREIDSGAKDLLEAALAGANKARHTAPASTSIVSTEVPISYNVISSNLRSENVKIGSSRFGRGGSNEFSGRKAGSREVICCICFEEVCTIEVQNCGHQMCAVCTLALCCHVKPNPAIPRSPPPACPFCRRDIAHLVLARTKSKKLREESETLDQEKSKPEKNGAILSSIKNNLRSRSRRRSRTRSHGSPGTSKDSLSVVIGGSSRRSSTRIADAEWFGVGHDIIY